MAKRLEQHLTKWREDVRADILRLTEELDELLAVEGWLIEQLEAAQEGRSPRTGILPVEAPEEAPEEPQEAAPEPEPESAIPEGGKAPTPGGRWGTWTRVSMAEVRDLVRQHGEVTAGEAASLLGCSDGNVRPKLQEWVEKGTMESERIIRQGENGRTHAVQVYRMKEHEHSPLRAQRTQRPDSLRLVGGTHSPVARTGKRNPKLMKRRGKIKGVKGH